MNIGFSASAMITGIFPSPSGAGKKHPFELRAGPFFGGELQVISLQGRERVNDVYRYEVTFATNQPPEIISSALFGMPACLTIKVAGHDPRVIQGLASSVEALGGVPGEQGSKRRRFRLEIVPRLWLLRHRRQNRVFQNKSVPEIIQTVLSGVGIKDADCRWRADRAAYPALPFVYQRGESDYDFFRRVLASAGIFFFYEHANGFLDSMFGGGASAVAGAVGAAAGMMGGAVASAVSAVESAMGMVPVLNLGSAAGHTAAVTPGALAGLAGGAMGTGLGALAGAMGGAAGGALGAVAGAVEEPSDTLPFDDGMGADADVERVFEFALKKELCTKELRMLDRDVEAHESWVGVARVSDASASLNLSAGLSALASGGLSGAAHAAVSFDVDAPTISASTLRQELYQADVNIWQDAAAPNAGPSVSLSASLAMGPGTGASVAAKVRAGSGARGAAPVSKDAAMAKRLRMELDRARRKYQQAVGQSDCRRLGAGYRFTLGDHPIGMLNGEYTVTALDIEGTHPDFLGDDEAVFRNRFRCVPSGVAPRPKRPKPRPRPGMEVARVVGFVGGEARPGLEANNAGYVRVRFRWDILDDEGTANGSLQIGCATDDVYSVWLPVVQPWAGAGYGAQFIPREGMEVLVGFMEDQTERPVILGCLYSEKNRPPWPDYVDHQRVGIRSQTRPAHGGYSELSIDDRKGGEVLRVRAQRDMDVTVLRESRTMVGADHVTSVKGGMNTHVAHDRGEQIGGSSSSTIRGSESRRIEGSATTKVAGVTDLKVGGNDTTRVGGSQDTSVGANVRLQATGSRTTAIGGADTTTVGGRHVVTVGASGDTASESNMYVWGTCRVGAKKLLSFDSETEIVLRCGTSELHLRADGITLTGKTVDVTGSKQLSLCGSGPSLTLGDSTSLTSKQISLQSSGARLSLSDSAALTSSAVKLGKPIQAQIAPTRSGTPDPNAFSLAVLSPDHTPLANCKYLLELGGTTVEGTTDAAGSVSGSAPPGVTSGRCTVWTADFPEGPRVTVDINLEKMEPASEVAGAQKRLRNLGYFTGKTTCALSHHLRDALLTFQYTHNLSRTGILDDDTVAKLAAVHP